MPQIDPSYLNPTWYVDSDSPSVVAFAAEACGDAREPIDRAVRLFYAVRDKIRYSAYGIDLQPESFRASRVLELGRGWCVTKACLYAAAARAAGIPCRLGFADVKNHLATAKLRAAMGTDVFCYHGYNELWLEGKWVKATVAFNRSLCEKARLKPLEFDGRTDSLYHPFDLEGRRHMEYLHDYGAFADVPVEAILAKFAEVYPRMTLFANQPAAGNLSGDFESEVAAETAARDEGPA
ncbi:MAG: transglutaminase family protein [Planctomycetaceae bacterium]|nr:transglutaminase family protein [Planctomycetaceae bacterium]